MRVAALYHQASPAICVGMQGSLFPRVSSSSTIISIMLVHFKLNLSFCCCVESSSTNRLKICPHKHKTCAVNKRDLKQCGLFLRVFVDSHMNSDWFSNVVDEANKIKKQIELNFANEFS